MWCASRWYPKNPFNSHPFSPQSHLSEFLALLTLKTAEEQNEDFHVLHERLVQLKLESLQLDSNFHSPDYYTQKEELIFKVVCEIKGIDHDKWLRDEQGFGDPTATSPGEYLEDKFVCDDAWGLANDFFLRA